MVNGPLPTEGQLEIYHSGRWGTVGYNDISQHVALVVCGLLGYTGGKSDVDYTQKYGCVNDHIMSALRCSGEESSLFECSMIQWTTPNDQSHGPVAVITCGEWHM